MDDRDFAAFISYNSADRDASRRLQHALESYSIPKSLRGRTTRHGVIGARIGKVCRDRTDFKTGESLNAALVEALERSSALVVLCSPESAASKWVNAEVEHFQKLGRGARIFPVVVRTDDAGIITRSFPPALQRQESDEAIAADLQPSGDGWHDGVLKVLASILDVDYDALRQRALHAARQRARIAYAIAGGMFVLAVTAVAASYFAIDQRNLALRNFENAIVIAANSAARINQLTDQTEVPRALIHRFLEETQRDLKEFTSIDAMSGHPQIKIAAAEFELLLSDLYSEVGRSQEQLRSSLAAERWMRAVEANASDPGTRALSSMVFGEQNVEYFADVLSAGVNESLGRAYANNGVLDRARAHFDLCRIAALGAVETWELTEEELRLFRGDALSCASEQANMMAMLNQPGAAVALLEPAIAETAENEAPSALGYAKIVLSQLYADNSRLNEALDLLNAEIARPVADADGRQARMALAKLFETRANALVLTGKISGAVEDLDRADDLLSEFLKGDANDRGVLLLRGELLTTSGEAFALAGDGMLADEKFTAAGAILGRLIEFDGGRRDWRLARVNLLNARSDNALREYEGNPGNAAALALARRSARAALDDVAAIAGENDETAARLRLIAEVSLARALRLDGDIAGARNLLAGASARLHAQSAGAEDEGAGHTLRIALVADEEADLAAASRDFKTASRRYDEAISRYKTYLKQEPAASLVVRDLLWLLMTSAKSLDASGDAAGARRRLAEACALKSRAALSEYSLFVRDSKAVDALADEFGIKCVA